MTSRLTDRLGKEQIVFHEGRHVEILRAVVALMGATKKCELIRGSRLENLVRGGEQALFI